MKPPKNRRYVDLLITGSLFRKSLETLRLTLARGGGPPGARGALANGGGRFITLGALST